MNALEIARAAAQFKREYASRPAATPASTQSRIKIIAGSRTIGDAIGGRVITGLGKSWAATVADADACVYGLEPGRSHRVIFQYAYVAGI